MEARARARESGASASRCPYCHDALTEDDEARCLACSTPQHAECFREHGSCVTLGCDHEVLEWKGLELRPPEARIRVRRRVKRDLGFYYWRAMIPAMVISFLAAIGTSLLDYSISWWPLRWLNWVILPLAISIAVLFVLSVVLSAARGYFAMLSAPPLPESEEQRAQRRDWQSAVGMGVNSPRIVSEDAPVEDWEAEGASEPAREPEQEPEQP